MINARTLAVCVVAAGAAVAAGQGYSSSGGKSVKWARNAQQAIAQAKKSKLPLMFFIEGDSQRRDQRLDDDRRKAFKDQRVIYASRRFVSANVVRSDSRLRSLFAKLQVPAQANMMAVFATPDGVKIDSFSAVHQPDTFAQKMTLVFNAYRNRLFDNEIKAVLNDRKTKTATIKKALKVIEKFDIVKADAAVIAVLDRWKSDLAVSKQGFAALAALSTKPCVDYLFAKAATGRHGQAAAAALAKCTPEAAELMLPMLKDDDPDTMLLAYNTVTKICKVKKPKPDRFWTGKNENLKRKELDRVRKTVEKSASRWKDSYGRYR
jgi:hypothetical protein